MKNVSQMYVWTRKSPPNFRSHWYMFCQWDGRPCPGSILGAWHLFRYVTNDSSKANSAFHPSGVGKWVPASAGKSKAGMVHSVSGWTRDVQVRLWDSLRTPAIPERLRGVFTTMRYTNPRLPLPFCCNCIALWDNQATMTVSEPSVGRRELNARLTSAQTAMMLQEETIKRADRDRSQLVERISDMERSLAAADNEKRLLQVG